MGWIDCYAVSSDRYFESIICELLTSM